MESGSEEKIESGTATPLSRLNRFQWLATCDTVT